MENKLDQSLQELNRDGSKSLQFLKIIVIVMGVMIVAGVIVIAGTIISRTIDKSDEPLSNPWLVTPKVPIGGAIESVTASDGRVFVSIKRSNGETVLIVFDSNDGKELGRFSFDFSR